MYHTSTIKLAAIEKLATRDEFPEPYHKVTFEIVSEGIPTSQMVVWVHPAYREDDLTRVARTFAWRRLLDLSEAANVDRFSEAEIQLLWERVKPAEF